LFDRDLRKVAKRPKAVNNGSILGIASDAIVASEILVVGHRSVFL
jgi:hypothetical protein